MMGMGQYILYYFVAGDLCWIGNYKIISEEEMSYVIYCTVIDEIITEEIVTNKYSTIQLFSGITLLYVLTIR